VQKTGSAVQRRLGCARAKCRKKENNRQCSLGEGEDRRMKDGRQALIEKDESIWKASELKMRDCLSSEPHQTAEKKDSLAWKRKREGSGVSGPAVTAGREDILEKRGEITRVKAGDEEWNDFAPRKGKKGVELLKM